MNYAHWDNLVKTTDPAKKQAQSVWEWELRTYFGLTFEQVQEMKENWNLFNTGTTNFVMTQWPSNSTYHDRTGCAYWQWADSHMTRER